MQTGLQCAQGGVGGERREGLRVSTAPLRSNKVSEGFFLSRFLIAAAQAAAAKAAKYGKYPCSACPMPRAALPSSPPQSCSALEPRL